MISAEGRRRHARPAQVRYSGVLNALGRVEGFADLDRSAGLELRTALGNLEGPLHAIGGNDAVPGRRVAAAAFLGAILRKRPCTADRVAAIDHGTAETAHPGHPILHDG